MFSKACEYGIRATVYIALRAQEQSRVSLKDIAREIDSPVAFTAKILQQLAKHQVVSSVKGASGGFEMSPQTLQNLKLTHVVMAIDGDRLYRGCGLGLKICSEAQPCPVHHKFKKIREQVRHMLETTTILELAEELKNGSGFLRTGLLHTSPVLPEPELLS